MDKAEGDAYDKMRPIAENEGIMGYSVLYTWYIEISGLGLTEQSRRLMNPEAPKNEEDVADAVDNWVERVNDSKHMGANMPCCHCTKSQR